MHKFDTFDYLKKFYLKNNIKKVAGFKIEYDLPKSYKFHKKGKIIYLKIFLIENVMIDVLCLEANVSGLKIIEEY